MSGTGNSAAAMVSDTKAAKFIVDKSNAINLVGPFDITFLRLDKSSSNIAIIHTSLVSCPFPKGNKWLHLWRRRRAY